LHRWQHVLRRLTPITLTASRRERWLGGLGVALGLLLTEMLARHTLGAQARLWFIAPMGASAVLLYMVPASPLAQPWAVWGGNVVSALVGVACHHWLGGGGAVAALACGLATWSMMTLRCLHPPGGAVALMSVLGGPAIDQLGFAFVLSPVVLNVSLMVVLALLFHNVTGRAYPHHPAAGAQSHGTSDPVPSHRGHLREDVEAALASFGTVLDVDREDLEELLVRVQLRAQHRRWNGLCCRDIMSRDVVSVREKDSVDEAWRRLVEHRIKALPVVDVREQVVGIVSLHDFFVGQSAPDPRRLPVFRTARCVADVMTRPASTVTPDEAVVDLVQRFADAGRHHLPVVDVERRLVGIVTQSDLVAALFKALSA
jgi:CBS domain-containing membrane protein